MTRVFAMVLGVPLMIGSAFAMEVRPHVDVERGPSLICPYDDCYLTLVDESLCVTLDKVFDETVSEFTNNLNCLDGDENSYVCLNVLSKKRYSEERKESYSDPHLLELMTDFQVQLDKCLREWTKSIFLTESRQAVSYRMGRAKVVLGLTEFVVNMDRFDRLTLELSAAP
jgi:hypothetical protein